VFVFSVSMANWKDLKKTAQARAASEAEVEGLISQGSLTLVRYAEVSREDRQRMFHTWFIYTVKDAVKNDRVESHKCMQRPGSTLQESLGVESAGRTAREDLPGVYEDPTQLDDYSRVKGRLLLNGAYENVPKDQIASPAFGANNLPVRLSLKADLDLTETRGVDLKQGYAQVNNETDARTGKPKVIYATAPPGSRWAREGMVFCFVRNHYGRKPAGRNLWIRSFQLAIETLKTNTYLESWSNTHAFDPNSSRASLSALKSGS